MKDSGVDLAKSDREQAIAILIVLAKIEITPLAISRILGELNGDFGRFWKSAQQIAEKCGVSPARAQALHDVAADGQKLVADVKAQCQRLGLSPILRSDSEYPPFLQQIHDPPELLFVRGTLEAIDWPLGVVGSRTPSHYGASIVGDLLAPAIQHGAAIISGLAYGIDALAHEAALKQGGITWAILGSGHGRLYPRAHAALADRIVKNGGAIISEFLPDSEPKAEHFPKRNRIIAGISKALLVVEAKQRSGALITARLAISENRDTGAVPGDIIRPQAAGPNQLIRDGALPIIESADVLSLLGMDTAPVQPALIPNSPLLAYIQTHPGAQLEEAAAAINRPASTLIDEISELELSGQLIRHPDGRLTVG